MCNHMWTNNLENDTLKFREKGEILLMTLILEQGGMVFHDSIDHDTITDTF